MKKQTPRAKSRTQKTPPREDTKRFFSQMLKAVTAGLFTMTVLLLLFSFLLTKMDVPLSLLGPVTQLITAVSCALSGFLLARKTRSKGLRNGAISGFLIFLVLLMLSFFFSDALDLQLVFKLAVCLSAGAIGGICGVNAKTHRRK